MCVCVCVFKRAHLEDFESRILTRPALKVLSALDLCYNEMTSEIARSLANILPGLPALTEVRVNGNEFGEAAIEELTEASR